MAKRVPEVPGASLADIAFMLLIFFLVTTTMDVDSGLRRVLPPMPPEEIEDTPPINERNVFVVLVDQSNRLMVEGAIMNNVEDLREKAKEFLDISATGDDQPEKIREEIPYFGEITVNKNAVISLWNDVGTQYGMYVAVQNELVGAINELRDELARSKFGKPYESLDEDKQRAIRDIYPQKISEAEPKKVGGR